MIGGVQRRGRDRKNRDPCGILSVFLCNCPMNLDKREV